MIQLYDPKTGEMGEEPMPFIHLCPNTDCLCEDDVLAGISPASGLMVPAIPEWILDALEEQDMGFKRPTTTTVVKPMPNAWNDQADKADFPNLFGFLTETKYDDDKPRLTGSISIFTQVGVLKASISDKDNKRVAYVEALTLHELVETIERAIFAEDTVWREQQPYNKPPY